MEKKSKILVKNDKSFELSTQYKVIATLLALVLVLGVLYIYFYLIFVDPKRLDPDKFGLPNLLIFLLTFLVFINVPFSKLGLRIKKIGIIELEEKIEVQARDVSHDIAELQLRIDKLERSKDIDSIQNDNQLEKILYKFLKQYSSWGFSPLRIEAWGALQPGYEALKKYTLEDIKPELRRMLIKKYVITTISKKGHTLYRFNKNGPPLSH